MCLIDKSSFALFSRVRQEEEARKREIEEVISIKNERSKMVTTEKEEIKRMV